MGIKQRILAAKTATDVDSLRLEAITYAFIADKTLRQIDKAAAKRKAELDNPAKT